MLSGMWRMTPQHQSLSCPWITAGAACLAWRSFLSSTPSQPHQHLLPHAISETGRGRGVLGMQCSCSPPSQLQTITQRRFAVILCPLGPPRHTWLRRSLAEEGEGGWDESTGPFGVVGSGRDGIGLFWKEAKTQVRGMSYSKSKEQPRGSLWRTRSVISRETVQAVHDLKRHKDSPGELAKVLQTRISRLLKMDMLATLSELQRQNEIDLALQIFDLVRKEIWYKPDRFLYRQMLDALGKSRRIFDLEKKFEELQDEGIIPELVIYREMVGAYIRAHMLPEALEMHAKMVECGCGEDPLTLQFIETGKEKEAVRLKQRRKAAEKLEAEKENEDSITKVTEQEESSLGPEVHIGT